MRPEDFLLLGLTLVAGIGIGLAIMLFMRQQPQAPSIADRVVNEEKMTIQRGPEGEFLGYIIHRDVQSQ